MVNKARIVLIFLVPNLLYLINAQEPITDAQRVYEFLNYGPLGLLNGILPATIGSLNISNPCSLSLNHTIDELRNGQLWPNLMIASNGEGLSNLLEGTYLNLGNYDQCLSVVSSEMTTSSGRLQSGTVAGRTVFHGQYCLLDIAPQPSLLSSFGSSNGVKESEFFDLTLNVSQKLDILFRFPGVINSKIGFCLPSTCSNNDVTVLINSVLDEHLWRLLKPVNCQVRRTFKQSLTDSNLETKISFSILLVLLACVLLCTALHLLWVGWDGFLGDLIRCFSIQHNLSRFSCPRRQKSVILDALQSFVVLFCVISHSYLYFLWLDAYVVYAKIYDYLFNVKSLFYQPFVNVFDINTSLLFLVPSTFACIKLFSIEKINFSKSLKLIASHLLTYFPLMLVLVAIQMALPLLVAGPISGQFLSRDASFCSRYWYRNLLFINNFYDFDEQCVLISWTISTEIQLFALFAFLVLLYSQRPLLARTLNLILLLSSMSYIISVVYTNSLSPSLIEMPFDLHKLKSRAKLIHFAPFAHVFEYFLPPFVFNLIFNKRVVRFHVNTRKSLLYLLIFTYFIVQFYGYPFVSLDYRGTGSLNALVVITCRLTLPVFFAWTIYNYHDFGLTELLDEIGLTAFYGRLFAVDQFGRTKRLKDRRFAGGELEMVANLNGNHDEADGLMRDVPNTDYQLIEKRLNEQNNKLTADGRAIDKLVIEMQGRLSPEGLLRIKLDELILNESSRSNHLRLAESINRNEKNSDFLVNQKPLCNHQNRAKFNFPQAFANLLAIYSRLTRSLYFAHHFYLTYDLYTVRSALPTDLYHIVARLAYNLFYCHLLAILFHLLIERPLSSSSKLIGRRIFNLFSQ